jgi:hypothetical protein
LFDFALRSGVGFPKRVTILPNTKSSWLSLREPVDYFDETAAALGFAQFSSRSCSHGRGRGCVAVVDTVGCIVCRPVV